MNVSWSLRKTKALHINVRMRKVQAKGLMRYEITSTNPANVHISTRYSYKHKYSWASRTKEERISCPRTNSTSCTARNGCTQAKGENHCSQNSTYSICFVSFFQNAVLFLSVSLHARSSETLQPNSCSRFSTDVDRCGLSSFACEYGWPPSKAQCLLGCGQF